jgi:hypothetical protein
MTYRFHAARATLARDPGHLRVRDRAVVRILNRAGAATSAQLTTLAYGHRRLAQERLRQLWTWGLLERAPLPPAGSRGGAPIAYRLTTSCLRRLGYTRSRWRGPGYLEHTLDAVDAVCALVRGGDRDHESPVQLWLPELVADDVLTAGPVPDAVVVISGNAGSGVVCVELDEATQHFAPIVGKLRAYRRALAGREGWLALFIVPSDARRTWLRKAAASVDLDTVAVWTTTTEDLTRDGLEAPIDALGRRSERTELRAALADQRPRRSPTPVGSEAWLELLGTGGSERLDELLA